MSEPLDSEAAEAVLLTSPFIEGSPEPAGGSDLWTRPGIAGHRPLAGDGASRRPKGVSKSESEPFGTLSNFGGSLDYGVAPLHLRSG